MGRLYAEIMQTTSDLVDITIRDLGEGSVGTPRSMILCLPRFSPWKPAAVDRRSNGLAWPARRSMPAAKRLT